MGLASCGACPQLLRRGGFKWLRAPADSSRHGMKMPGVPYDHSQKETGEDSRGAKHPAIGARMQSFEDNLSEEVVIQELCRARVTLATNRHDAAFFHNIAQSATPAHDIVPRDWGKIPVDIFPPRRTWHRFRPKHRAGLQAAETNYRGLYDAVLELRQQTPPPAWAIRLQKAIDAIRGRVSSPKPFVLRPPTVIAVKKEPSGHQYRPLAIYPLADKIIEGLTARYLRTNLDGALLGSCMAFRCGTRHRPPPTTHDALAEILEMRARYPEQDLYVAECDIKGFFDCVGHSVAKQALIDLVADSGRTFQIHPRALEIFSGFLESYSFLLTVRGTAQKKLKQHDPQGIFKWHEADLQGLYGHPALPPIGVPQGGALSCLIANAVLHEADKAVASFQKSTPGKLLYLRYCDDMILISPDRKLCATAFAAYREVLERLRLPAHLPVSIRRYTERFWDGKSKHPYRWADGGVPWIQFVGYQIRYDGAVRIRAKSIRKHLDAVTRLTDRLLSTMRRASKQHGVRRTASEIQHRFRQKLISMAVGRITLGKANNGPMPMSWAAGFRGLDGRSIFRNHLKVLDRHRERQVKRVSRAISKLQLPSPQKNRKTADAHKYYGRPFSYWAQFR